MFCDELKLKLVLKLRGCNGDSVGTGSEAWVRW